MGQGEGVVFVSGSVGIGGVFGVEVVVEEDG